MGAVLLPTTESMKAEFTNLAAEERLLAEYKAARTKVQEYDTVKQNVDTLLVVQREQINNYVLLIQKPQRKADKFVLPYIK